MSRIYLFIFMSEPRGATLTLVSDVESNMVAVTKAIKAPCHTCSLLLNFTQYFVCNGNQIKQL